MTLEGRRAPWGSSSTHVTVRAEGAVTPSEAGTAWRWARPAFDPHALRVDRWARISPGLGSPRDPGERGLEVGDQWSCTRLPPRTPAGRPAWELVEDLDQPSRYVHQRLARPRRCSAYRGVAGPDERPGDRAGERETGKVFDEVVQDGHGGDPAGLVGLSRPWMSEDLHLESPPSMSAMVEKIEPPSSSSTSSADCSTSRARASSTGRRAPRRCCPRCCRPTRTFVEYRSAGRDCGRADRREIRVGRDVALVAR